MQVFLFFIVFAFFELKLHLFFSFQYVNELSGGNQGGQARENRSDILKRKIPL